MKCFTYQAPTASCLLALLLTGSAFGQEWTRFRGPNGSGVSDTLLPIRWTDEDRRWKVALPGVGHSSPVLWGNRIFVTSGDEATGKRLVLCLRADDGQQLWTRDFTGPRHGKHQDNSFASATPVVNDRYVYTCWGSPGEFLVLALDHNGKDAWRVDLGPYRSGHGFGASPIVHEDLLVVPNDQDGPSALVGLDGATGKVRWKVPRHSKATYTTPCVYQPSGRPAELIFTNYEHGFTSIDPKTGRVNWEADLFSKVHIETSIGSPIVAGDLVLGASGWLGVRQEVIALRPASGGKPREVYRLERSAPLCTTPLVKGELLFLWSDGGLVTCAHAQTGEVYWRERVPGSYYSSPVCAGKYLYNVSRDGEVVVLAADRHFELAARNEIGEGSHGTPAIASGRMYLRTFGHLLCIGKK